MSRGDKLYHSIFVNRYTEPVMECGSDFCQALDAAMYLFQHRTWIPCSEKMPKLHLKVLITDIEEKVYPAFMIHTEDGDLWIVDKLGNIGTSLSDVVAWMPYPEPYKKEEE